MKEHMKFPACPVCGQALLMIDLGTVCPPHPQPGPDDRECPGAGLPWVYEQTEADEALTPEEARGLDPWGLCGLCGSIMPGPHAQWCDR